jgi:hypothetical protein
VKNFGQRKESYETEDNSTYADIGQLDGSTNSLKDVTASNSKHSTTLSNSATLSTRVPCTTEIDADCTTVNRNHLQANSDGEIDIDNENDEPEISKQLSK